MTDETPDPTPEGLTHFGLALAPDGVPYILPGADEVQIQASTSTTYYFTK